MENTKIWDKLKRPPATALKQINAGRLKGKSDINPQWRMQAMTEVFGMCGMGWKYTIDRLWLEPGTDGQMFAFALVSLYINDLGVWLDPIPGIGGHMLIVKESSGLHNNDEAFKMATTDALSVAMKALGVAADIYAGLWDGSKYTTTDTGAHATKTISDDQAATIESLIREVGSNMVGFLAYFGIASISSLPEDKYKTAVSMLEKKRKS